MPPLVLASASPRRTLLLSLLHVPFRTAPSDVAEEALPAESAMALATRLAAAKAAQATVAPGEWVLAADTVVALGPQTLGKPASRDEAQRMLRALRGRWHEVVTGVCLRTPEEPAGLADAVVSRVRLRRYRDDEISASIARGTPFDKAGGYAIQDEVLRPVETLDGCYLNVVGLPLCAVARLLQRAQHPATGQLPTDLQPPCRLCYDGARLPGIGGAWLVGAAESEPSPGPLG